MPVARIIAAGLLVVLASGQRDFGIGGGAILCVPEQDLVLDSLSYGGSKNLQVGGGHAPGFSFLFSASDLRRDVPDFYVDPRLDGLRQASTLSGSLGFLDEADRRRAKELWLRHDACRTPVIEPIAGTALYRAHCDQSHGASLLLDRRPDPGLDVSTADSSVVAACRYETLQLGRYSGNELRSCSRVMLMDGFLVNYDFQEGNAGLIRALDKFVQDKITEWRNNCHPTRRL